MVEVMVRQFLWKNIEDSFVMLKSANEELKNKFASAICKRKVELDYAHPYKYLKDEVRTLSIPIPSKYEGILEKLQKARIELFCYTFPDLDPIKYCNGEGNLVINLTGKMHIVAADDIGCFLGKESSGKIFARVEAINGPSENTPQVTLERLLNTLDKELW